MICNSSSWSVLFTTEKSAPEIDLVAVTNNKTCPTELGVAINVTDTTMTVPFGVDWSGGDTCAVVASSNPTPTADPCWAKIDSTAVASMSASLAATLCTGINPPVNCSNDESAAQQLVVVGVSVVGVSSRGLGGTSDWASDLQEYYDVPEPATSWGIFKEIASSGEDPKTDHTRNGNWTELDCTHPITRDTLDYTPSERWKGLNADAAWRDHLKDLENKFAPVSPEPDNTWLLVLIDLLTLGTLSAAAPFCNSVLKKLPHFHEKGNTFDNSKDTTLTMIGQSTTIAKDLLSLEGSPWTPGKQDAFSRIIWARPSMAGLMFLLLHSGEIFNGTEDAIDLLWTTMSIEKLIDGKFDEEPLESGNAENELRANIAKSFLRLLYPRPLAGLSVAHSPAPTLAASPRKDQVQGSVRTWCSRKANSEPPPTRAPSTNNPLDVDITTPGSMRVPPSAAPERAFPVLRYGRQGALPAPCTRAISRRARIHAVT
ncbi:hypothetical protein V493_01199 [Pseudogymnoascus sp. VKM F-4281 (FW-2241)]|nr:hypothetical protein V493_01199 [Pseudogymnoascus sp. VKM F-4281 (FW-2241)]